MPLPPQFFLISHRSDVFRESSFSWYCSEIKASILVRLQAPYYAIGLSKTFAIGFDNVIAEVEKTSLIPILHWTPLLFWFIRHPCVNICVLHVKPYETDSSCQSKTRTDMRFYM